MIPKYLLTGIAVVVSVVFVVNFAAQFFVDGYVSDPAITGVFGLIAGAAYTLATRQGKGDPAKPDDKPSDAP